MNDCSYNIGMKFNREIILRMEKMLDIASDATRIKILLCLLEDGSCSCFDEKEICGSCKELSCMSEKCVNHIVNQIGASQSLVSHQLKVLKDANFVSSRKEGTKIYYRLKDGHVKQLLSVVLEHVLEEG